MSRAILHDPEVYTDPDEFIPERFLNDDGTINDDDVHLSFGYGRR
jgi:cytochrome P450